MIIADSIAKGLHRYTNVWNLYFEKHTVNHGIGEDKVENVVWRIGNVNENEELRYVVLICGTNNIDKNAPEDIVKGIKYAIRLVKSKFYSSKIIVSGILSRELSPRIWRDKIRSANFNAAAEMSNNAVYIESDQT